MSRMTIVRFGKPMLCGLATAAVALSIAPARGQDGARSGLEKRRPPTSISDLLAAEPTTEPADATAMRKGASRLGGRDAGERGKEPTQRNDVKAEQITQKAAGQTMQRLAPGLWVEGPGFEITYGVTYDNCAAKCLANAKCVMIEFYRPEKKCNLYSQKRPTKKGGSSDVSVRG